ncbi:MAG: fibrobacter succinogenes major paralogous domain-containing protein, partial [Muribaculaceae bacterium]|nr:fibrobacter succinogenes major paralogous domain-containing protein [Muribaculaceae bacterium]
MKKHNIILALLPLMTMLTVMSSCGSDTPSGPDLSKVETATDFVDPRDGRTYKCVKIGDQIWMAENLAYFTPGGSFNGCFTWNQTPDNISSLDLDRQVFIDMFTSVVQDPNHNWKTECGLDPERMLLNFQMFYIGGSDTQTQVMNSYSSSAYRPFSDEFNSRKTEYVMNHFDEFETVLRERTETADAAAGNYSKKYGYLYSFEGAKKACPDGWRVPTDADWKKLEQAMGMSKEEADIMNAWRGNGIGKELKRGGSTGFNALMAGCNAYCGGGSHLWINQDESCYFWTSEFYTYTEEVEKDEDDSNADS